MTCDLYALLTTQPNADVAPVHINAMPVILTTEEKEGAWFGAPWGEAQALQRPLPDGSLTTIARGETKNDEG